VFSFLGSAEPCGQRSRQPSHLSPTPIHLRDGELVVYRRSRSLLYQCRYKLADGSWHRQSTGKASVEHAIARACDLYDEARYRQRLGLAHRTHLFAHIAAQTLVQLRQPIDAGVGQTAYHSDVSCIECYFVPYFVERRSASWWHSCPSGLRAVGSQWNAKCGPRCETMWIDPAEVSIS
jgi:hypothetical protein